VKEILAKIVEKTALEARWLNTLSLLEMIGARKIGKTVCQAHPALEILEHLNDETRHALIFKKLSRALDERAETYLCRDEAISYFQMLDATASEWLSEQIGTEEPYYNYCFVTCLIERRAMQIYPVYKKITPHPVVQRELAQIIAEETNHRHFIEEEIKKLQQKTGVSLVEEGQKIEQDFFDIFMESVKREIS